MSFWNSSCSKWWESRIKLVFCRFQQFQRLVNTFTTKVFPETRPFMHLSKHLFGSQQLQKYWSYNPHFFFHNVPNLMEIQKIQWKITKMFAVFQILPFEVIVVNCHYYYKNTCSWHKLLTSSLKISDLIKNDFF